MSALLETIKAHPVPVIGGGLVLGLILLSRNSGPVAPSATSAALNSQQLADNTNVALAGINADVTKQNLQGQTAISLAGIGANGQAALARTAVAGNLFNTMIGSQAQLAALDNTNMTRESLGAMATAANMDQIAAAHDVASQQIAAGVSKNAQLVNGQIQLAQINAQQQQAAIDSPNYATMLHTMESINANNNSAAVQIAGLNDSASVQTANANNQAAVIAAQTNSKASSNNSNMQWAGLAADMMLMFM